MQPHNRPSTQRFFCLSSTQQPEMQSEVSVIGLLDWSELLNKLKSPVQFALEY